MNIALHIAMQAAAAEKRILEQLRQVGAFTSRTATEFSPEDSMEEQQLMALIRLGAVVHAKDNFYYLNEEALAAREARNQQGLRRLGWILAILLVCSIGLSLLLS